MLLYWQTCSYVLLHDDDSGGSYACVVGGRVLEESCQYNPQIWAQVLSGGKLDRAELEDTYYGAELELLRVRIRSYVQDWARAMKNGAISEGGEVAAKRRKLSGGGGRIHESAT